MASIPLIHRQCDPGLVIAIVRGMILEILLVELSFVVASSAGDPPSTRVAPRFWIMTNSELSRSRVSAHATVQVNKTRDVS